MKRLSRTDIRQSFESSCAAPRPNDAAIMAAIEGMSAAINDLQLEGIDVELMLTGCASEQGFQLDPGNNVSTWRQYTSGILRIGNSQHLLALCSDVKLKSDGPDAQWKRVVLLCVSKLDIRLQGTDTKIRTDVFNLRADNGLTEFQTFILGKATRDTLIAKADSHQRFSGAQPINLGLLSDKNMRAPKLSFDKKTGNGA